MIEIVPEWLMEIAPHYYKASDIIEEEQTKNEKTPKMPKAPKNAQKPRK